MITLKRLHEVRAEHTQRLKQAQAAVHTLDGAIQAIDNLIAELQSDTPVNSVPPYAPEVPPCRPPETPSQAPSTPPA